ncbi:MAG: hypothetical protein IH802_11475 [Nitrospinae bacterium]|nr:hypothetical protein [Nitrospinota bacterium]
MLVAYEIYRRGNDFGQPAGVLGKGGYGIEILISLAYQVYGLGLSLDKACKVMRFFQSLDHSSRGVSRIADPLVDDGWAPVAMKPRTSITKRECFARAKFLDTFEGGLWSGDVEKGEESG